MNKKIKVMVFGTFDIVHKGHIHMLKEAKEYGDILVVVIARDKTIANVKKRKQINDENARKKNIEILNMADKVILGGLKDKYKCIRDEKPDFIALGYDQKTFVDELADNIDDNTQIVRLAPFQPEIYKSSLIAKKLKNSL